MNQIVDFELRGLGTHMARRRSQMGWIEQQGKSWVGYAYKYEQLDDGTEKRRVKQHVIGRCAEMNKATRTRPTRSSSASRRAQPGRSTPSSNRNSAMW